MKPKRRHQADPSAVLRLLFRSAPYNATELDGKKQPIRAMKEQIR